MQRWRFGFLLVMFMGFLGGCGWPEAALFINIYEANRSAAANSAQAIAASPIAAVPVVSTAEPRGRVLSMVMLPRLDPSPTQADYVAAYDLVQQVGVRGTLMTATWKDLEPAPGVYKLADFNAGLDYVSRVRGYTVLVGIQVLNTIPKETPTDLMNVAFDAPEMKTRFHALIDALLPSFNEHTVYLSIGNEVDGYLGNHPDEWATYKNFYDDGVTYLHQVAPWIQVGVTTTFDGTEHGQEANIAALNEHSDVVIMTYYPQSAALGQAASPAAPLVDFPKMVALANGKPLILQEVGFGTSPLLDSSEAQQAAFVGHVFNAWNAASDRIPFLSYFALHDFSETLCDAFETYYGFKHGVFHAFLCSLGLRRTDGTPKAGWQAFADAAKAQGFAAG